MKRFILQIVYRFIRLLWSAPIAFVVWVRLRILLAFAKPNNPEVSKYLVNRNAWEAIRDLDGLVAYFRHRFAYKWDGMAGTPVAGIFDHDNTLLEFLFLGGDCNDAARFAALKLRQLGYQARRWAFINRDFRRNHFDCVYQDGTTGQDVFNFGHSLDTDSSGPIGTMNAIFVSTGGGYIDAFPVEGEWK